MDNPVELSGSKLDKVEKEDEQAVMDSLNSYAACFCCNPFENVMPDFVALQGQAFDLIVVQSKTTGRVACSDFLIRFEHPTLPYPPTLVKSLEGSFYDSKCEALLEVESESDGKMYFPVVHDFVEKRNRLGRPPKCDIDDRIIPAINTPKKQPMERGDSRRKSTQEEEAVTVLAKLLKPGKNHVRYLFCTDKRVMGVAHASIFLWSDEDRLVICDVDGTITKSNVRGIYDSMVSEKYTYCHDRVCHFMSSLLHQQKDEIETGHVPHEEPAPSSNVRVLYLTSRPLVIAQTTRKFLSNLRQRPQGATDALVAETHNELAHDDPGADRHRLPEGPLMGFSGNVLDVMKMELVSYTVHLFKASVLMDQVVAPFCHVAEDSKKKHRTLFVAGFGNTIMDVQAYHMAGMDLSQIYMIDKKSRIHCLDGHHHHSKNGYSSATSETSSTKEDSDGSTDGTFLFIDGAEPDKLTNQRPVLRQPLSRKVYTKHLGTAFHGYHDENLSSHVFSRKVLF